MVQPINYSLDLPDPTQNILNTLQVGEQVLSGRQQRELTQQAADAQIQQQQAARGQQEAMRADFAALGPQTTTADISNMLVKYPDLAPKLTAVYDTLEKEEQKGKINEGLQIYSALDNGEPALALEIIQERKEAYEQANMKRDADGMAVLEKMVRIDPNGAKTSTGMFLSAAMGPDQFSKSFSTIEAGEREKELQPARVTKAEAQAEQAATAADFYESQQIADLSKKGWEVEKIKNEIGVKRENARIAAMKKDAEKETNALKRDQLNLKIEDAKRKRDIEIRKNIADASSARASADNLLNTIDKVLQTPQNVLDNVLGPISSTWVPTVRQSSSDLEDLIGTLSSQVFMSQVPNMSGMGQLSDAEGKKIESSLQSLSLRQSPERLLENLREIQRLVLKARSNLSTRFGVPENLPDRPAMERGQLPTEGDLPRPNTSGFRVIGVE